MAVMQTRSIPTTTNGNEASLRSLEPGGNATKQQLHGVRDDAPCALMIFLHIPKAGGTTVDGIFRTIPGWNTIYPHRGHNKGTKIVAHIISDALASNGTAACSSRPCWSTQRINVMIHTESERALLFNSILPHVDRLRAVYRKIGGHFTFATILREPGALARSYFSYFHVFGGAFVHPIPPDAVKRNQTRLLTYFRSWLNEIPIEPLVAFLSPGPIPAPTRVGSGHHPSGE